MTGNSALMWVDKKLSKYHVILSKLENIARKSNAFPLS